MESVAELVNSEHPIWEGTATQLCKEIQSDMAPNILTRKLNVDIDRLNREFGVHYSRQTKHEGKIITLTYSPRPNSQQNISLCDDQKVAPHIDMTTESGSDATGEITRDDCNDCDDSKIIQPTAVTVDSVKVVYDNVVVCEDKRDDCDDRAATQITIVATSSGVDTADMAVCENGRDGCNDCNDETTTPITVAADGSDVNTADKEVCEDGSIVNMADVVCVYERDDCNACDD